MRGEMFRTKMGEVSVAVKSWTFLERRCARCPKNGTGWWTKSCASGSAISISW